MIASYLRRGVLAGVLAGIPYGLFVAVVASPLLAHVGSMAEMGHGHEESHAHSHAHGHEAAHAVAESTGLVVSAVGGVLWAVLLAGVLAIAFAILEPALPGQRVGKVAVLGAAGFVSVSAVPWLVLPPAVPGAEVALGIDVRLAIYAGLVGLGLLISGWAIAGYCRLAPAGRVRALVIALAPGCLVVAALAVLAPSVVTQPAVGDDLVAAVQGATVVSQAALWAGIVAGFAWLQGRAPERERLSELVADPEAVPSA